MLARILIFDQVDQGPQCGLAIVLCWEPLATQAIAKAIAKAELGCRGDVFTIQIVVAVWIEKAVAQDGWCDFYARAEQGLQSASSPGIAAGLDNIGHA